MKWKWWHNILVFSFGACHEKREPELKEDLSIIEKKEVINLEVWKALEGQWREVKKDKDHWKVALPCDGEGNSLIFSKRRTGYSFAQFKEEKIVHDVDLVELSLVETAQGNNGRFQLQGGGVQLEASLKDGILSLDGDFFSLLSDKPEIERLYLDKDTCIGNFSFEGISNLQGDWYDTPCGSVLLTITGKEFVYRSEGSEILWLQPEGDNYWLTLKKAEKVYGVFLAPKETTLQIWNGRYDDWSPINLYKKAKNCTH